MSLRGLKIVGKDRFSRHDLASRSTDRSGCLRSNFPVSGRRQEGLLSAQPRRWRQSRRGTGIPPIPDTGGILERPLVVRPNGNSVPTHERRFRQASGCCCSHCLSTSAGIEPPASLVGDRGPIHRHDNRPPGIISGKSGRSHTSCLTLS
jgi:hypothetical protein